ncbi:type II secretion protein F [Thermococcus sp. GR7]|uniref:type II secretion system F family protein n=1 Tax=unclassified Thermococcus TaxID=2627626 RepID=UPI00142F4F06|nr:MULTISPECIES: type II secretion system F family protein [unclassified Thermococcus]NJE46102.1 type II secretion protein F [Thermococcus sp. GR7]NJE78262.1 type II secretion protein F [Thermococcus sp. GR4]NJF22299.1 type II secretion protein F [Thermococcus sp. GR5]
MPRRLSSLSTRLIERLIPKMWLKRYEVFIYSAGINFLAVEYLVVSFLVGIIGALVVDLFLTTLYALAAFLALFLGMAFGYPYWKITKRIEEMEKMLPDAFFYLASSLRAGISFSEALEELTTAKFGALTEEFKKTVAEIKKGRSTVEALRAFAIRNRKSTVIYRSMMIIIEAIERGAPMSDILVFVGNDVREILRIKKERKASTGMQVMFFIVTSGFIGPLILGIVSQVMGAMSTGEITFPIDTIKTILLGFVVLQAIVSGLGIGVIREGKFSAGLKYSLLLVVMGVVIFQGASSFQIGGL